MRQCDIDESIEPQHHSGEVRSGLQHDELSILLEERPSAALYLKLEIGTDLRSSRSYALAERCSVSAPRLLLGARESGTAFGRVEAAV